MQANTKALLEFFSVIILVTAAILPFEILLSFGANLSEYLNKGKDFNWLYFGILIVHILLVYIAILVIFSKKSPLNKKIKI
jgi:hypothetical protein